MIFIVAKKLYYFIHVYFLIADAIILSLYKAPSRDVNEFLKRLDAI
jgi:hypothetical protein